MIRLERVRSAEAIPEGFRGKRRIDRKLLLLKGFRQGKHEFDSDVWKAAKKQLKAESHGKCAYCEADTNVVAHGDVEHFRPKSVYWWLAYCYDNYLYSCQICNQVYKGDNFPVGGTPLALDPPLPDPFPDGLSDDELRTLVSRFAPDPLEDEFGLPMQAFLAATRREKPHLPNPYEADPEPFFAWTADPVLKEVVVAPASSKPAVKKAFEAAVRFLGLNRDELRRVRWQRFEILDGFRRILQADVPPAAAEIARAQLREMMQDDAPFAGMARYFVRREWKLAVGE